MHADMYTCLFVCVCMYVCMYVCVYDPWFVAYEVSLEHLCGFWHVLAECSQDAMDRGTFCRECEDPTDRLRAPRSPLHDSIYAEIFAGRAC